MTTRAMFLAAVSGLILAFTYAPAALASQSGAGWPDVNYGENGVVRLPVPTGVGAADVVVRPSGTALVLASGPSGTYTWRVSPSGTASPLVGSTPRITDGTFRGVRLLAGNRGEWLIIGNAGHGLEQRPAVVRVRGVAGQAQVNDVTGTVSGAQDGVALHVSDAVVDTSRDSPTAMLVGWSGGRDVADRTAVIGRWDAGGLTIEELSLAPTITWFSSITPSGDGDFLVTGSARNPDGTSGYPLAKFSSDLVPADDFPNAVMFDPREGCQFAMADVLLNGADNIVVGNAWGCQPITDARVAIVAQQFPSGFSDEPFGSFGEHQGEGAVVFNFVSGVDWAARAAAVDSRGRIVVAGTATFTPAGALGAKYPQPVTRPRPLSNRLSPDGVLDTGFALNAWGRANGLWDWNVVDLGVDSRDRPILVGTATRADVTEVRLARLRS